MNGVDAVAKMAREFPGGVAAVAGRLGWNANVLRLKLCQTENRHHLTLAEAEAIQELCGQPDLIVALAESLDLDACVVTAARDESRPCGAFDALRGLSGAMAEVGDYARELDKAVADGVVTPNERRALEKELLEATAALFALHRSVCGRART